MSGGVKGPRVQAVHVSGGGGFVRVGPVAGSLNSGSRRHLSVLALCPAQGQHLAA